MEKLGIDADISPISALSVEPIQAVSADVAGRLSALQNQGAGEDDSSSSGGRVSNTGEKQARSQMAAFEDALRSPAPDGAPPQLDGLWDGSVRGGVSIDEEDESFSSEHEEREAFARLRPVPRSMFYGDVQEDEAGNKEVSRWTKDDRSLGEVWRDRFVSYVIERGHESFDGALESLARALGEPFSVPVLRALSEAGEDSQTYGLEPVRFSARAAGFLAKAISFSGGQEHFIRAAAFHSRQFSGLREIDVPRERLYSEEAVAVAPVEEPGPSGESHPRGNPIMDRLGVINGALEARGLPRGFTPERLSASIEGELGVELDPWMLLGYRPMPPSLREAALRAAAQVLFDDLLPVAGESSPEEIGRFMKEAGSFLSSARLDAAAGQASPWRKSLGGLLRMFREEHGLTQERLGEIVGRLSPLGRPLTSRLVRSWESDQEPDGERVLLTTYLKIMADFYKLGLPERQALVRASQRRGHARVGAGAIEALGQGRSLREYLGALVQAADNPQSFLEIRLDLPAGAVGAYLAGEAVPSLEIIDRFTAYFGLRERERSFLSEAARAEFSALRARGGRSAALAAVLGAATADTPLWQMLGRLVLEGEYDKSQLQRMLSDQRLGKDALERLMSPKSPRRHAEATARAVASVFAPVGSAAHGLIMSVARARPARRPLGTMLEEYIHMGGKDFPSFLRLVLQEQDVTPEGLSKEAGLSERTVPNWISETTSAPEEDPLGRFAVRFGFSDRQTRALWYLARGEKGSSLAELLRAAREALPPYGSAQGALEPSRRLLTALVRRSGLSNIQIAHLAQVSHQLVSGWRNGKVADVSVEKADRIAWTLLPHEWEDDARALARSLANLFLGMAREFDMGSLLDRAWRGEAVFADIVLHTRLRYRMSHARYGRGMVEGQTVKEWESGHRHAGNEELARNWAASLSGNQSSREELIRLARGHPLAYDSAPVAEALDAALAEEGDFWDVIQAFLDAKGMTQAELAEALGVEVNSVTRWKQGGAVKDKSLLPRLAEFAGLGSRIEDFIRAERDRLPAYDPAVLRDIQLGRLDRDGGLHRLRKNRKRTAARLAQVLGVSEGLVRVWEREGSFGNLTKVGIAEVCAAYGVPKEDEGLFLSLYDPEGRLSR